MYDNAHVVVLNAAEVGINNVTGVIDGCLLEAGGLEHRLIGNRLEAFSPPRLDYITGKILDHCGIAA
jgi:hypothetical protein